MINSQRLKAEEFIQFNRELLGLVKSGVPVPEGLKKMAMELPHGNLKDSVNEISRSLENGTGLSEAIKSRREQFGDYYCSLVNAGEKSGKLETALSQAVRSAGSKARFFESLKVASIYPVILLISCFLVTMIVAFYLTPKMEIIYKDHNLASPYTILIQVRNFITMPYGFLTIIFAALLCFVFVWWIFYSGKGNNLKERILMLLPFTRRLVSFYILENFCRSLGILLESNVAIEDALILTRENINSPTLSPFVDNMLDSVRKGKQVSTAMDSTSPFPPTMKWMISLSEGRGNLDKTLLDLADLYESKREFAYRQCVTLAQPIMILIAGLIVGTLILATYLPYFFIPSAI
jgi:type II secretory pathway component PulF